jgi:hypothetical protein
LATSGKSFTAGFGIDWKINLSSRFSIGLSSSIAASVAHECIPGLFGVRRDRNLAFIATLMDSGVEFVAVDNPHANKLTIHILAAVAQHEREMIAQHTKDALQAARYL